MQHILDLIRQNGDLFYLITFVWTALEGETFVIFAGLAAHQGLINIFLLFLAAWLGSFVGDQVFFWLGREFGTHILVRYPRIQPKLDIVFGALERYATIFILSYRFMYGVRNISGIAIGMSHLSWRRFFVLNLTAAFIWAFVFCGAGYLFGDIIARMADPQAGGGDAVKQMTMGIAAVFVFVLVARAMIPRWVKRKSDKLESDIKAAKGLDTKDVA